MAMIELFITPEFDRWLASLRDRQAAKHVAVRLLRVKSGNFGDVQPIGEGLSELRIHHGAGYRVYLMRRGKEVVVILAGGNKASQQKDIKRAKELAHQWR